MFDLSWVLHHGIPSTGSHLFAYPDSSDVQSAVCIWKWPQVCTHHCHFLSSHSDTRSSQSLALPLDPEFEPVDLEYTRSLEPIVMANVGSLCALFFEWMSRLWRAFYLEDRSVRRLCRSGLCLTYQIYERMPARKTL